jgi:hypothetical protein
MNENEWTTPEAFDDRTQRLIDALPTNATGDDDDGTAGRLTAVLARRKPTVAAHLQRVRALLDAESRDSQWAMQLSAASADLCDQACIIRDFYDIGTGCGSTQIRADRRAAVEDWNAEALNWERFSDRARCVADWRLF